MFLKFGKINFFPRKVIGGPENWWPVTSEGPRYRWPTEPNRFPWSEIMFGIPITHLTLLGTCLFTIYPETRK